MTATSPGSVTGRGGQHRKYASSRPAFLTRVQRRAASSHPAALAVSMSAQSYSRGPLDPSAQRSRCHPAAGHQGRQRVCAPRAARAAIISSQATAST